MLLRIHHTKLEMKIMLLSRHYYLIIESIRIILIFGCCKKRNYYSYFALLALCLFLGRQRIACEKLFVAWYWDRWFESESSESTLCSLLSSELCESWTEKSKYNCNLGSPLHSGGMISWIPPYKYPTSRHSRYVLGSLTNNGSAHRSLIISITFVVVAIIRSVLIINYLL